MGWKKSIKKIGTSAKHGGYGTESIVRGIRKKTGGKKYKDSGDDYRGEAAGQMVSEDVTRQAGSGQISYTNERVV